MKATGIVRKVDQLGRIVIPKELRDVDDLREGTPLEIYVNDGDIVLKKYEPACIFCGESEGVFKYKGKNVCKECIKELEGSINE